MKNFCALSCLLLMMAACAPENKEVTDEQIQTGSTAQTLDSITDTRKDVLRTDQTNSAPTLPLPQPVMELLALTYPGWEQPPLTAAAKHKAAAYSQDAALVRGDFNGDNRQDYALQLMQQNKLVIAAILDFGEDNWKVYELKQEALPASQGNLESSYYLYVVNKGEKLESINPAGATEAPYEAVGVGLGENSTTYLFRQGEFHPYGSAN